MPFLKGNVNFLRFTPRRPAPRLFDSEHIDRLADRRVGGSLGTTAAAGSDGAAAGWAAGSNVLDTAFSLEKNVVNDALVFDLRVDTDRLPGDLMKAYYERELAAPSKDNPSGFASARQKREAKDIARERLEDEAKDGRFRKRKCIPAMWDRVSNTVLFGATSLTHVGRFCTLFEATFGAGLECLTAGGTAAVLAELAGTTRPLDDASPTPFVESTTPPDVSWIADERSRDFLGNEFLLWLWNATDVGDGTFTLSDKSEVSVMLARTLTLECPRGQTGQDTFKSMGPARLPEAKRAAKAGKLPRRCGLTLVRHDKQYELTLHAEAMAVGGCKLPKAGDDVTGRAVIEERVTAIRELQETLDLLYGFFLAERLDSVRWGNALGHFRRWLGPEGRRAAA